MIIHCMDQANARIIDRVYHGRERFIEKMVVGLGIDVVPKFTTAQETRACCERYQ
jgi:hypothetical protein